MREDLLSMLLESGASKVGVADLTALSLSAALGYQTGIAIGVGLDKEVIARIPGGPYVEYCHAYNTANELLESLGQKAEAWLESRGYRAYAVTRDRAPYEEDRCVTGLPHKTVARLAGFGWIGKNALLITKEYGCAIRLTTVLTDAAFAPDRAAAGTTCGNCRECVEACPAGAITGAAWGEEVPRDRMLSFAVCQDTLSERGKRLPMDGASCGLCIAACPFSGPKPRISTSGS